MANTKISQLPSYTGSAADLRWFVMNNSGETETFKYSGYSGLLIPGTGVDSIVSSPALTPTYGPNPISSGLASIAIGSSNTEASANFALALGWNCRATAGGATAIGVSNNASADQACVIGYASSAGGVDSFCGGVESNSGGFRSVAVGKYAAATGSESVAIGNAISSETNYSTTIGGIQLVRDSQYSSIIGGRNQTIITDTSYNNIFGASDSDIRTDNGSGGLNTIIGGKGNYISGATSGTTLIGLNGYTEPLNNDTAYVKNLKVLGQSQSQSNNRGSVSTGTITLDFNTGNIQYFQLTSGSTIVLDATNYKDGATYIVKVKQPSSGTNATMSYTSPLFKFSNGTPPSLSTGNNQEDILTFVCIGTTLYGNISKTFS
jgi:hypothetical protein